MNIIKINNVKRITTTVHGIDVKSNEWFKGDNSIILILSDDEIQSKEYINKLRGYFINVLIVPKKYKRTLFKTPLGEIIKHNLREDSLITYY